MLPIILSTKCFSVIHLKAMQQIHIVITGLFGESLPTYSQLVEKSEKAGAQNS